MAKSQSNNKSLLRAVDILRLFTPDEPKLGPADVVEKMGMPITSARRFLTTWEQSGLLQKVDGTSKYTIGPDMYLLGAIYLQKTDLYQAAEPVVSVLNKLSQEAISLCTFDKGSVVYVMFRESPHFLNTNMRVGSIIPAHCSATGRAFLAELSDDEIDDIYPEEELEMLTDKTVSTKTELKRILCRVKEAGASFDSEGTYLGSGGVASVIRDRNGVVAAALGIAFPTVRMNTRKCEVLSGLARRGADLISYRLGYTGLTYLHPSIEGIRSWWEQNKADS